MSKDIVKSGEERGCDLYNMQWAKNWAAEHHWSNKHQPQQMNNWALLYPTTNNIT